MRSQSVTSAKSTASKSDSNASGGPNGTGIRLHTEISELDRAFWLVLDMELSQHNEPADLGYYYECSCEDTFTFDRLQVAAAHFSLYECNKALKPDHKVLVKYVNVHNLASVGLDQAKPIMATVLREFELLKRCNQSGSSVCGILDVYLVCCRTPNVYYMFVEKADLNLAEYIQQHSSLDIRPIGSEESSRSIVNKRTTTKQPIATCEARFILASVGSTVRQLHRIGIVHGSLTPHSVFIFKRDKDTNAWQHNHKRPHTKHLNSRAINQIERVKLANFAFATYFDRPVSDRQSTTTTTTNGDKQAHFGTLPHFATHQSLVEEMMRSKDITMLYDIAVKVADRTEFATTAEQEQFLEVVHSLFISTEQVLQMERDLHVALDAARPNTNTERKGDGSCDTDSNHEVQYKSADARLEYFVEAMWTES